ncbi:Uncharacterized protein Fot_19835 [Forsythia ovata]|uniref:Uncharacterized protein n=1 Tax=Forsythia ovata TaxID=205694 RepID=A0ABD1VM68_9LAMI
MPSNKRSRVRIVGDVKEIQFGVQPPVDSICNFYVIEEAAMVMVAAAAKQDSVVGAVAKAGVVVENSWFMPKKGSVLPAKRRSVKKMIFDDIIHCILSCFGSPLKSHRCTNREQPN